MTHTTLSVRFYVGICAVLLLFTGLTAWLSTYDLGGGKSAAVNVLAAVLIAATKSSLVILFFMHLKYSNRLTWVVGGGVLFWLMIAVVLTMADYLSRPAFPVLPPWSGPQ
ncbi:MAG TPA: cytochrome C oxidase subunit IV family protein [Candidatus Sulfotelmatobacter sp.]|nr:cytochrome C oxidase subunit IV family protein [Candidatus Sulfotelmatobacter sp.]